MTRVFLSLGALLKKFFLSRYYVSFYLWRIPYRKVPTVRFQVHFLKYVVHPRFEKICQKCDFDASVNEMKTFSKK